jgi:hypothetical protein
VQEARFFGPISATAYVAWQAVHQFNPDIAHDAATLRTFMSVICEAVPGFDLPIDVWRVSPNGCARS